MQLLFFLTIILSSSYLYGAASAPVDDKNIVGVYTGDERTHALHMQKKNGEYRYLIVSTQAEVGRDTLRQFASELLPCTKKADTDVKFGKLLLKKIRQAHLPIVSCAIAEVILKSKTKASVRSCTFGQDASGKCSAQPYSTTFPLKNSAQTFEFTDAHCIIAYDCLRSKTPSELAQATFEQGKMMRVTVNFKAWRDQRKKRT